MSVPEIADTPDQDTQNTSIIMIDSISIILTIVLHYSILGPLPYFDVPSAALVPS